MSRTGVLPQGIELSGGDVELGNVQQTGEHKRTTDQQAATNWVVYQRTLEEKRQIQRFKQETSRLGGIKLDQTNNYQYIQHRVYRPKDFDMTDKIIAALTTKRLEHTPTFSGKNNVNVTKWLKDVTNAFKLAGFSDTEKNKSISTFLRDDALTWYTHNMDDMNTWSKFNDDVQKTYSSPLVKEQAAKQLRNRQQGVEEALIHYYNDIMDLCQTIDSGMTDETKLNYLMQGLKISLRKDVTRQEPKNSLEFIKVAQKEEFLDQAYAINDVYTNNNQISTAISTITSTQIYPQHQQIFPHQYCPSDYPKAQQQYPGHQHLSNLPQQDCVLFDTSQPRTIKTSIHHVINTSDHPPVNAKPYFKTIEQRRNIQQQMGKMLRNGIIVPLHSPWSSSVILLKKSNGEFRFIVDYRKLNSITKKDSYPQPTVEELLQRLGGHSWFTKLDFKSGNYQIPIQQRDKEKTAFVTQDGLYQFEMLLMGLMNAPPTFQR
ncbi:unnamed protein product, partial [Didymodactylos carnosus]